VSLPFSRSSIADYILASGGLVLYNLTNTGGRGFSSSYYTNLKFKGPFGIVSLVRLLAKLDLRNIVD